MKERKGLVYQKEILHKGSVVPTEENGSDPRSYVRLTDENNR